MNYVTDTQHDNKPWYRQFWPWLLILLPASAVVGGITTIIIALNSQDSVVEDNYYKQGLAINRDLARDREAENMGIHAKLRINSDQQTITLQIHAEKKLASEELQLRLLHPTLSARDQTILLKRMDAARYQGFVRVPEKGDWNLILEPMNHKWRIAQRIHIEANQDLLLR